MAAFRFDPDKLADALERAGYDADPTPPGVTQLSARREGVAGGVAVVVVDGGGRLRFTLTRDVAPEQARDVTLGGRTYHLVDTTTRTTVALLTLTSAAELATCLADLERAAAG
ncbi:MAG TPA: hypothetical protein VK066_25035 [Chloroflexota bacterium]|nr:hypothetical protein [Chloroflexota bacterium]